MNWFTGNIGYHHVHHLNAKIPFYRLPEAMENIEELQSPTRTSLRLADIVSCLQLKLWDPATEQLLTFRQARMQTALRKGFSLASPAMLSSHASFSGVLSLLRFGFSVCDLTPEPCTGNLELRNC